MPKLFNLNKLLIYIYLRKFLKGEIILTIWLTLIVYVIF